MMDYEQIRKIVREELEAFDEEKAQRERAMRDEMARAFTETHLMMLRAQEAPVNQACAEEVQQQLHEHVASDHFK